MERSTSFDRSFPRLLVQGKQSIDLVGTRSRPVSSRASSPSRARLSLHWLDGRNPGLHEARADVYLNGEFLTQLHSQAPPSAEPSVGWQSFGYRFHATARRRH